MIDLVLLGWQIAFGVFGIILVWAIMTLPTRYDYCPSCKGSVTFEEIKNPLRMKCKTCGYETGCLNWKLNYRWKGDKKQ